MAVVINRTRYEVIESAAVIIHVEDIEDWRDLVKEAIEMDAGLEVRAFLSVSTIEEAKKHLETISGPVVLLTDLRTEERRSQFAGYDYILTDFRDLLSRNASTAVFVISAELTDPIEQRLHQVGIPSNHIYDKGTWGGHVPEFTLELRETVLKM